MASEDTRKRYRIAPAIFGLVFLLAGLGVIVLGPLHTLIKHGLTSGWERVPAQLEYARLTSNRVADSGTTNAVDARYHYVYEGRPYAGRRVGYDRGSDNISRYNERLVSRLERAQSRGSLKAWVNPDAPSESYLVRELRWKKMGFMAAFGAIFSGAGVFLVWTGVREPSAASTGTGPIASTEKQSYWLQGFLSFAFLAVGYPAYAAMPAQLAEGNWYVLFFLLFPVVGFWLGYTAWKTWRGWRRFGPAPLSLDPAPGQVGGDVGGRIALAKGSDEGEWVVTLQCLKVDASRSNRSGLENMLWHEDQVPEVRELGKGMEILFRFEPPDNLHASGIQGRDQVKWRLLLHGGGRHPLRRTYECPVEQGTARSAVRLSESHVRYHEQQGRIRAISEAAEQIEVRRQAGGWVLHSRIGRHLFMKLTVILFGSGFAGFGAWMWRLGEPEGAFLYMMSVPFLLIGLPLVIGGVFMMGRSLTVSVKGTRVSTVRYWLGLPLWRRQGKLMHAEQLTFHGGISMGQGGRTTDFMALAVKDGSKTIRLAEGLVGRPSAEAFRDNLIRLLELS
ncbi:DUF3592 domain-containing protein [Marinobacter bryozoorum]|uniref:DUF3592 domain-containing protein n=1 Tax=Marinobacter bryozoorum TaxID=256324 RepID=UPI00200660EC|nr:DUF3592 domain-containing protein [Marinobacter bryozoorum]